MIAKVIALNLFAPFFVAVLYMDSLLLFCYRSFNLHGDSKRIETENFWKIVGRAITIEGDICKGKKQIIAKMKQRRLITITLRVAIEKSHIALILENV